MMNDVLITLMNARGGDVMISGDCRNVLDCPLDLQSSSTSTSTAEAVRPEWTSDPCNPTWQRSTGYQIQLHVRINTDVWILFKETASCLDNSVGLLLG